MKSSKPYYQASLLTIIKTKVGIKSMEYQYALSYPILSHSLMSEKDAIKTKYICLLKQYFDAICSDDLPTKVRLDRFILDFLAPTSPSPKVNDSVEKDILKTRFTPFRLFSYRYVFLFDCIFLLAPENHSKAIQIVDRMKSTVHSRYHKKMDFLVDAMFHNSSDLLSFPLITPEMIQSWDKLQRYIRSTEKKVIITATMSSGKSTLINALIGRELSFSKKAACTATVMDFIPSPVYHHLYHALDSNHPRYNLSQADIKRITDGLNTPLCVVGYFESILNKCKVRIIDTPGVNSSLNPLHKQITRNALSLQYYDVIVYVIPVESYGSANDYDHLQFIKQKASYGKIIFVVNMMDTCDLEDDSISDILADVSEHLIDLGFNHPIVCPISAKAGLLFKQALTGVELSKNDSKALIAYYSKYATPEYDLRECYAALPEPELHKSDYKCSHIITEQLLYQAFISTGLPQFEQCITDALKET